MTLRHIRLPPAALLLLACGCTLLHERAQDTPRSRAAGDEGMLLYTIGRLTFEAPAGWDARGDARHVLLRSAAGDVQLDAQVADRTFSDDAACLADAEDRLVRRASSPQSGPSKMTNVRRHPTTVAGRKAVVQEADQSGWHGWAWALCDRGEQYLLYFTGHSPLNQDAVRASRLLPSSATLAAGPSA